MSLSLKAKQPHQVRHAPSRRAWLKLAYIAVQAITFGTPLAHAEQHGAKNTSAESAAGSFYAWYLREMSLNRVPFEDSAALLKQKVATSTLSLIRKQRNSANGMDMDYFIQAQDYADEWLRTPRVKTRVSTNTTSELQVTLGAETTESHDLNVSMTWEDQTWKVLKVTTPSKKKS